MDVLFLSRFQFGAAAFFHFLFVPLTLGLSILAAIMETIYVRTGDHVYKDMARFWGRLFIINFAVGVVTGLTLEFQFGTNWSGYSKYVGDVFGSLLAIEATVTFFLESTFLAVWIFGWKKLSPKMHAAAIWLVALASTCSAFWILAANAWMQHPIGFEIRNGRAELTDFIAVITQPASYLTFIHTVSGAYILSGFFVMGVSAYHLIRKNNPDFFTRSFRIAVYFAMIFSLFEVAQGHLNGALVARIQPVKLAAMESFWDTRAEAPQVIFLIPDPENERNSVEFLPVPGVLSYLAFSNTKATVQGLKDFPKEDRPPVVVTFAAFRVMVGLGFLFPVLAAIGIAYTARGGFFERLPGKGLIFWVTGFFERVPRLAWMFVLAIPLPYLALEAGWIVTEIGRQPWIVYNMMRTADAVSPVASSQVAVSLAGFILVYTALGAVDFYLLYKYAKRGPEPAGAKEA